MSFLDWIVAKIDSDRQQLIFFPVPQERVSGRDATVADYEALQAGRHYFRLWLSQMFLDKEVYRAQHQYPAVHSLVQLQFGSRQSAEFPNVADSSKVGLQESSNGAVIPGRFLLTPLLPFSGGTMKVAAGLVRVRGENYLNSFIGVFGEFADLLAVPQLSAVLDVAGPLTKGMQNLFGQGDLHLGLHDTFVGGSHGGYMAAIRATEQQVDTGQLLVVDGRLRRGTTPDDSVPFDGFDHMLFRLELLEERDDWPALTVIDEPLQKALEALGNLEEEKAEEYIRQAKVAALKAPELTTADRRRVLEGIVARYEQAKAGLGLVGLTDFREAAEAEPLSALAWAMEEAPSVQMALAMGEPAPEEYGVAL